MRITKRKREKVIIAKRRQPDEVTYFRGRDNEAQ